LDGYHAKVVVLFSLAGNDVSSRGTGKAEDTIRNIRGCVAEVRKRQPQAAVLLVPTPDLPEMVAVLKPAKAAEGVYSLYTVANRAMAEMADGEKVFYLRAFDEGLKKRSAELVEEMKEIIRTGRNPHDTKIMYEVANEALHDALADILAKRSHVRGTGSPEKK
jgi:hypothetical protein